MDVVWCDVLIMYVIIRVALVKLSAVVRSFEDDELWQKPQVTKPLDSITNRQD